MATTKQKQAARENLTKAQRVRRSGGEASRSQGMSTAERNDLSDSRFAFSEKRKVPLNDARHVRNAIARFDQVEGVSDRERDAAWKRIIAAARKFDVDVEAHSWRQLMNGGKSGSPQ